MQVIDIVLRKVVKDFSALLVSQGNQVLTVAISIYEHGMIAANSISYYN